TGDVLVVPAPSGLRRRLRGQLVAADLADAVAAGIAESGGAGEGRTVRSVDLLRRSGGRRHQHGLDLRARRRHRATGVRLLSPPGPEAVAPAVGDALATGATPAPCAGGLARAVAGVAGRRVVAATPRPGRLPGTSSGPRRGHRREEA